MSNVPPGYQGPPPTPPGWGAPPGAPEQPGYQQPGMQPQGYQAYGFSPGMGTPQRSKATMFIVIAVVVVMLATAAIYWFAFRKADSLVDSALSSANEAVLENAGAGVSGDCETDITKLQSLSSGGALSVLPVADQTLVSQLLAAISTECPFDRTAQISTELQPFLTS